MPPEQQTMQIHSFYNTQGIAHKECGRLSWIGFTQLQIY